MFGLAIPIVRNEITANRWRFESLRTLKTSKHVNKCQHPDLTPAPNVWRFATSVWLKPVCLSRGMMFSRLQQEQFLVWPGYLEGENFCVRPGSRQKFLVKNSGSGGPGSRSDPQQKGSRLRVFRWASRPACLADVLPTIPKPTGFWFV